MTPDMAFGVAAHSCKDVEGEAATTRKVLAAFPAGQETFKPHEKSMGALELAYHISSTDIWFLNSIAAGEMLPFSPKPESIQTFADVVADHDARFGPALAAVRAMSGEALAKDITFFGIFTMPAVAYLNFLLKHSIHHRGQASVYVRLMGGKVPSIYGGSADEPFQAGAGA